VTRAQKIASILTFPRSRKCSQGKGPMRARTRDRGVSLGFIDSNHERGFTRPPHPMQLPLAELLPSLFPSFT
jgi:hypothetical protein